MWTSAKQIVQEAATNPQVQGIAIAVVGAVAWKTLDVYDTVKNMAMTELEIEANAKQAELDREAEAVQRQNDRDIENARHREALEAENIRHRDAIEAEAKQRQLDRESAERIAYLEMTK